MDEDIKTLERLYDCFNNRDIEAILVELADDVAWANGMDGGHVHGREEVRAYWIRQWAVVSPRVEPLRIQRLADGGVVAEVVQTVRDLDGNPLREEGHGLKDKTVEHLFRFREGKVVRFDIKGASTQEL